MKTTRKMLTVVMVTATIGLLAGAARAAIVTPAAATSTSTIGSPRTIDATIDGSDLSSGGLSGDILSETHAPNNDKAGYWLSASGAPSAGEVLEFTIPKSDIDAIHHWVYTRSGETDRGLKTFDISFSTDDGATFPTTITAALLGDFSGPPPVAALLPQSKSFPLQIGVTDIRLSNLVNFGDASYIGLSEIRFGGPAGEVPEPATLVLTALGVLGLGGYARRRRRRPEGGVPSRRFLWPVAGLSAHFLRRGTMRSVCTLIVCLVLAAGGGLCVAETIIIDDGSATTVDPSVTLVGSWNYRPESGGNAKPHSYNGTGSRFAYAGDPVETATYEPNLPREGTWGVSLWWPEFNWTRNALVQINHADGSAELRVDQRKSTGNYGKWNNVGVYTFNAGTSGNVVISSDGAIAGESGVGPVADAVRFDYLANMIPLTATASSRYDNRRGPEHAADGSGMSDENGDGIPETHETNEYGWDISWMTASGDDEPWIKFQLNDLHVLDEIRVWNFNAEAGRTDRGLQEVDVYISSLVEDPNDDFTDPGRWTLVHDDFLLTQAPGTDGYNTPNVIPMQGLSARWVAMDVESNFGGGFYGLSEVQITRRMAEVPEPVTLVLAALGMLGLGGYARSSRVKSRGRRR